MTIPKIIHYCWFGKGDKPEDVIKYINQWRIKLPNYQIIEWNEENFDIHINDYVKEAYQAKKYAFVSDYARLFALFQQGGIYLDTDVEVIKGFDDLLENEIVLGFEEKNYIATSTICAKANSVFIQEFTNLYHNKHFTLPDGSFDLTTNVTKLTTLLEQYGLVKNGEQQQVYMPNNEIVKVLDRVKFSPYDYLTQANYTDETTYAIHHFGATWASSSFKFKKIFKKALIKLIGSTYFKKLTG